MWGRRKSEIRVKPRRSGVKLKFFLVFFLLLLLTAGAAYLVWFTSVFQIRTIEVNGGTPPQEELLKKNATGNLLFWQPPINEKDFPQIASLEVKRDFLKKKIIVSLKERQKEIMWCGEKRQICFWADEGGFIFSQAPFTEGVLLIKVVRDYSEREVRVGENILPPEYFNNLKSAFKILDDLNLPVDQVKLENFEYKEVVADLSNGPDIYFSFLIDPSFGKNVIEQLKNSPEWNTLRYIDLRVENRAYYSQ